MTEIGLEQRVGDDIVIKGKLYDTHTRCIHYHSDLDIIAIKFKCCDAYFPCYQCHEELTRTNETGPQPVHHTIRWTKHDLYTLQQKVVLCGDCQSELTFSQYQANPKDMACINCSAKFNPGCALHYHLYFEVEGGSAA